MKIIGGSARGVPLLTVPDNDTRPILDRLKKSFFSILDAAGRLPDARVADLYAGTGTQGLEALSRGAAHAVFVERRPDAVKLLKQNLEKTKFTAQADVRQSDVGLAIQALSSAFQADPAKRLDLVFYDPPFEFSREAGTRATLEAEMSRAGALLVPGGWLVLRTEKENPPPTVQGLTMFRHWTDGPHALCFYERPSEPA